MVSLKGLQYRSVLSLLKKQGVVPVETYRKGSSWRIRITESDVEKVNAYFDHFNGSINESGDMLMSPAKSSSYREEDWYTNYNSTASYHHY